MMMMMMIETSGQLHVSAALPPIRINTVDVD
jgi:hypothetical protein